MGPEGALNRGEGVCAGLLPGTVSVVSERSCSLGGGGRHGSSGAVTGRVCTPRVPAHTADGCRVAEKRPAGPEALGSDVACGAPGAGSGFGGVAVCVGWAWLAAVTNKQPEGSEAHSHQRLTSHSCCPLEPAGASLSSSLGGRAFLGCRGHSRGT